MLKILQTKFDTPSTDGKGDLKVMGEFPDVYSTKDDILVSEANFLDFIPRSVMTRKLMEMPLKIQIFIIDVFREENPSVWKVKLQICIMPS